MRIAQNSITRDRKDQDDDVIDLGAATEKTFGFPDLAQYEEEVIPRLRDTP